MWPEIYNKARRITRTGLHKYWFWNKKIIFKASNKYVITNRHIRRNLVLMYIYVWNLTKIMSKDGVPRQDLDKNVRSLLWYWWPFKTKASTITIRMDPSVTSPSGPPIWCLIIEIANKQIVIHGKCSQGNFFIKHQFVK